MARMRSEEVMVRLWLDQEDIVDIQTFAYEFDPESRTTCSDAEWVGHHFSQCLNGSDIYELLDIKEKGVYQILMKVTIRGFYSGWEVAEYDEELDVKEFQFKKMPDDWFSALEDRGLSLES